MSDDVAKLKAALRRAAADGLSGTSATAIADAISGAAQVLDAIDTAVLPRRMTVSNGAGAPLILEVAGRRLQRLMPPLPDGFAISAGVELKSADAASLAAGLLAFCGDQSELTIASQPSADGGDPAEGGIAPDTLRAELGLATELPQVDPEAELNMEPFINGIAEHCVAALWIQDEDVSLLVGEEDRAAHLSQWAAPMLEQMLAPEFPLSAALETAGIMVFVLPDDQNRHVLIAGRLGAYVVAEVNGSDPSETLGLWNQGWV